MEGKIGRATFKMKHLDKDWRKRVTDQYWRLRHEGDREQADKYLGVEVQKVEATIRRKKFNGKSTKQEEAHRQFLLDIPDNDPTPDDQGPVDYYDEDELAEDESVDARCSVCGGLKF